MNRKNLNFKLKTAKSASGSLRDRRESVRSVYEGHERPTPSHTDLRSWNQTVLPRKKPRYFPFRARYSLNTDGKCDLSGGKQDACGIKPETPVVLGIVIECCKRQVTTFIAARYTGQVRMAINFDSKVFHAGMIDHAAPGTTDRIHLSAFDFPKVDTVISPVEPGPGTGDAPKRSDSPLSAMTGGR